MSPRATPPFRADHVGSLLRPPALLKAREDLKAGTIDADELRGIEDEAIRDVVRKQEAVGLQSATDGEFRRASWHMDFIYELGGDHHRAGPHQGPVPQRRGDDRVLAGGAARRGPGGAARADLRRRLHVRAGRRDHGDAEADDPLAEHGPLPRRAGGGRRGRLPRHGRRSGATSRAPTPPRSRRWATSAAPTCSSTTPASPTSTTPSSASTSPSSGATPSTSTRPTSATSTRPSRTAPRG